MGGKRTLKGSTSALVFAVFPIYHLTIIGVGIAILLVRENKRSK
jgi:hypothetical protein